MVWFNMFNSLTFSFVDKEQAPKDDNLVSIGPPLDRQDRQEDLGNEEEVQ